MELEFLTEAIGPAGIAVVHSIFNITTTLLLLPFTKMLVRIAERSIKEEPETEIAFLDERLLNTPSIAVQECGQITMEMGHVAKKSILEAMELFSKYDEKKAERVAALEKEADIYEDRLGSYLVKLSGCDLSDADSSSISKMLHVIGDFERISDHAVNIVEAAREMEEKKIALSNSGRHELDTATAAIGEIIELAITAFDENDMESAYRVEPLEEVIGDLAEEVKQNHISRLQSGVCTIQQGFVLSDIMTNYARVSAHCSNIGVAVIELSQSSFDTHEYLGKLKTMDDPKFKAMFKEYRSKYALRQA